jgi:hypothetical protein
VAGEHKASERRIISAERRRKALELRKSGASYEMIARECGYKNRSRAFEAVNRSLQALTQDPAKEVLALELERLDRLLLGIWEKARSGDLPYLDRTLRIMERRSALYGLDRPRAPVDTALDTTPIDPEVAARMLRAALAPRTNEALPATPGTADAQPA